MSIVCEKDSLMVFWNFFFCVVFEVYYYLSCCKWTRYSWKNLYSCFFFMLLILLRWTREDEEGEKNEPTKTTIEQSSITIRVKETIWIKQKFFLLSIWTIREKYIKRNNKIKKKYAASAWTGARLWLSLSHSDT